MIKYTKKKCSGCRVCEIICSMEHYQKVVTHQSRIKYQDDWPGIGRVNFCRQCSKRGCMEACPEDALYISSDGHVQINQDKCTACLACSEACPYGDLPTDGEYPLFCDTCHGLYQCIKWCPKQALRRVGEKNG